MKRLRERVRIDELKARERSSGKCTNEEIAEDVFAEDKGRPQNGKSRKLSDVRKSQLIARWNNGHDMTALKPRHIIRLADFFKVYDVRELLQK